MPARTGQRRLRLGCVVPTAVTLPTSPHQGATCLLLAQLDSYHKTLSLLLLSVSMNYLSRFMHHKPSRLSIKLSDKVDNFSKTGKRRA